MEQQIRFCTSSGGTSIAYAIVQGGGPPVVYVAGFPSNLELEWDRPNSRALLDALAAGSMLVRYDMRGCGLSDRDVTHISIPALVSDLEAVIHAAGVESFSLLSLGMLGGPTAIAYAAAGFRRRGARLRGAVARLKFAPMVCAATATLAVACGPSADDSSGDGRPSLPTAVTTAGAGATATLGDETFVAVRTLPANALSAERLESVGEAQEAAGMQIAMARANGAGVAPWELVSAAPDGWRVWQPAIVLNVLDAAGAGATVAEAESVLWPNACLGVTEAGEVCAEVITPGYRVVIEHGSGRTEYHTDLRGNVRVGQ